MKKLLKILIVEDVPTDVGLVLHQTTKSGKSGDLIALIKRYSTILLFLFVLPLPGRSQTEYKIVFDDDPGVKVSDTVYTKMPSDSLRTSLVTNAKKYIRRKLPLQSIQ